MVPRELGLVDKSQRAKEGTSHARFRGPRIVALLLICLCCVCSLSLNACGAQLLDDSCTIYLYMCGSNLESEQGIASKNLDELLGANIPKNVRVIVQTGGASEWKSHNISASKLQRYEVSDHKLNLLEEIPNASMGASTTLRDFLSWGANNYRSDRNILILWDHGSKSADKICFDSNFNYDPLDSAELKNALAGARLSFSYNMIIYDACFMATVENAYLLHDYANYMVASQEMVPSGGLDYATLPTDCGTLEDEELGHHICDAYYQKCKNKGKETVAEISFMDLSHTDKIIKSLDKLCMQLSDVQKGDEGTPLIASSARIAAQFGSKGIANVVDLNLFLDISLDLVPEYDSEEFYKLFEALVPYHMSGENSDSNGASIFFPVNYEKKEFDAYVSSCPIKHYTTLLKNIFNSASEGITLTNKGSIDSNGNFTASLAEQSKNRLLAVSFELYRQDPHDTNKYTYLGTSMDVLRDSSGLVYSSNFTPVWPALNGQLLATSVFQMLPYAVAYAAPVVANGANAELVITYTHNEDYADGEYGECVLWGGFTETGMADKDYVLLKAGDVVATCEATSETGEEFTTRSSFTVTDETKVTNITLQDGTYGYRLVFDDVLGNDVKSNMALFDVKDGKATLTTVLER